MLKLGLISDIHAQYNPLKMALDIVGGQGVDKILCAGDLVEKGTDGDAVVRLLRERGIDCVLGNHDVWFFNPGAAIKGADGDLPRILAEEKAYNRFSCATLSLPDCQFFVFDIATGSQIDVPLSHNLRPILPIKGILIMSSDVLDALSSHVTIRDFTDAPLDDETLLKLLRAARRSPTSSNMQTYSLVVVRDQETKKKLSVIASNQKHIVTCPVFVAICADVSRLKLVCEMHDKDYKGNLERSTIAIVDAALVGMSLSLAAESIGLGTVMIGAMRNDPIEAARLLNLPDGAVVLFGLCIGWPAERPPQKPRLPEDLVIHYEQYNADKDNARALLEEHDKDLAEHYRSLGRETPDAAWTGTAAQQASTLRREFLRDVLEKLGFNLD